MRVCIAILKKISFFPIQKRRKDNKGAATKPYKENVKIEAVLFSPDIEATFQGWNISWRKEPSLKKEKDKGRPAMKQRGKAKAKNTAIIVTARKAFRRYLLQGRDNPRRAKMPPKTVLTLIRGGILSLEIAPKANNRQGSKAPKKRKDPLIKDLGRTLW